MDKITEHCTFDYMKAHAELAAPLGGSLWNGGAKTFINKGTNGLELLSVLITNNILGEASRIGFGSALAVVLLLISLGFIITYLTQMFSKEQR